MIAMAVIYGVAAAVLVGVYRRLALQHGWLDTPNARSSHRQPVPRGAGLVIVVLVAVAAATLATPAGLLPSLLPGLGLAAIGWWDDLRGVSARLRFAAYGLCAALALLATGIAPLDTAAGWLALAGGTLALLWLVNLYNFMDGINGLAAGEAMFVLGAGLLLALPAPAMADLEPLLACAIAIVGGFLCWNFPVARVFMGDVGSVFLGFLLGLCAVWSQRLGGPGWPVWLILGAVFIADATYTLLARIATGQRWHEAHRTHAYQKLSQRWGSHARVVGAAMGLNIAWLFPLAWATHSGALPIGPALALAYLPPLLVCRAVKAGIPIPTRV